MAGELAFFTMVALFLIIVVGSEMSKLRHNKKRQQLDSKTPYDYALANAINERDRLQDELRTIQALKRTEADTERIRNEIDTILSEDGERASEVVYGGLNGIPIVQHSDGTISPFPRWDGMSTGEAGWDATAVSRAYANANVREDVSKGERLTEDDVERSYNHSVRQAFCDRTFVRVLCTGGMVAGEITAIAFEHGELTELQLNGVDVSVPAVIEIRKGDDISGETLYRKGNR